MERFGNYRHLLLSALLIAALASPGRAEPESARYKLSRDPFNFSTIKPPEKIVEPSVPIPQAIPFTLRATLVAKQRSLADLDGKILAEGDELDGYRLKNIGEDEVVLEKDGKQVTVYLKK